ncbi:RNase adapter RapZ [Lentzea sp. NPDC042327]|uniref:RapZ C-terminal domain-containing protein n=1 Tax=Lentzea sp. NPDC042327 TaxID=3154801 RepID=UPI0033DACDCC
MTAWVALTSFGRRHRLQPRANVTFDVQALADPADVDELRSLSGLDDRVVRYVLDQSLAQAMLDVLVAAIVLQLHNTARRPEDEVRVAVFCEDGQRLSVVMVDALAALMCAARPDIVVSTDHLDLHRRTDQCRSGEGGEAP